jgi:hypothetical protein
VPFDVDEDLIADDEDIDEFDEPLLTPRWESMFYHKTQQAYVFSPHRFNTLPCGRRSGKTELLKRKLVMRTLAGSDYEDPRFFAAAPTIAQAKRIFWQDFKRLIPRQLIHKISEQELSIRLVTGAELWVVGLDAPERIEGSPWDGCGITEFANIKPSAWTENVRPALSDRAGWADLEGVPEGRNHYYMIDREAKQQQAELGEKSAWGSFHWTSEEVLPLYGRADELEQAKKDLDELTYEQEYKASFVAFRGMAYYNFSEQNQRAVSQYYDESAPLIVCFDFNIAPGIAVLIQEVEIRGQSDEPETFSAIIGEVWIERESTTPKVCEAIIDSHFGRHTGEVVCYGDATGGSGGTASVDGSDWDLIRGKLGAHFGRAVRYEYAASNPREKSRVNAVNARIKSQSGTRRMFVDPATAPHVVLDFEGVQRKDDGSLLKQSGTDLSHLTDAIGYYLADASRRQKWISFKTTWQNG